MFKDNDIFNGRMYQSSTTYPKHTGLPCIADKRTGNTAMIPPGPLNVPPYDVSKMQSGTAQPVTSARFPGGI